jgi:hypothetical protein
MYYMFQKELYNFESSYAFIQRTRTMFWTLMMQPKLALTSPTSGGLSIGTVRSRIPAFCLYDKQSNSDKEFL